MVKAALSGRAPVSRRHFLVGGMALGSMLVAACSQAPSAAPTTAPAAPTQAPAAAPTQAPAAVPTQAPAAPTSTPAAAAPAQAVATPTAAAQAAAPAANGAPVPALLRAGSGEEDFFNKAIDLFEQKTPGVKINRIFVPGGNEYITKLDLMIASGDPPAIYAPFSDRGYRYYAAKGLSQELDSFVKRDNVNLNDFTPDSLKGCRWKGVLMAFPLDYWPYVTFYNRDMFKAADLPDLPTDWSDTTFTTAQYLDVATKLTKKTGDQITQFGSTVYEKGWPAGRAFGGDWFSPDVYDTGICANWIADTDARVAAAIQWSADMINKAHAAPTPAQQQQIQAGAPNLFLSGKVGMNTTSIGSLSNLAKVKDFQWGIGIVPKPPKGDKLFQHLWIDFWSMIKGTKNLDGSWQLMKFMVSPEAQKIYPVSFGPMSSLLSLGSYWSDFYKKTLPNLSDKEFSVITEAPKYEVLDLENWTVNFSPINDQAINPGLDKIYLGQQTAEAALKDMSPKVKKLIDETKNV
jgi:multiple sugar transport system substrate-binding protein